MNGAFHASNVHLETKRLVLRPWRETDLQDLYAYAQVDGVGQMAGWLPHKSMEESKKILKMFITEDKTLALEEKAAGKVIGSLGLELLKGLDASFDHLQGREIGYVLSRDYWGQGLMPEAVKAVIDYCFTVLSYDFLACAYFQWNRQSRRVNEKMGFQFYKEIEFETQFDTKERTNLNILWNPDKTR